MRNTCSYTIYIIILLSFIFFTHNTYSQKLFTLISPKYSNVKFNNVIEDTQENNIFKYANYYGGSGVGIGDFNNDGLNDIFFAGNLVHDRLYFNNGQLKFDDVTEKAGIIKDKGWSSGVTLADVNNDGFLDIYVSRELYDDNPMLRKNLLYINNGNGTFKESAEQYGVANNERTRHATFFDYNKDNFLDLLLLTQPPNPGSYSKYYGTKLLLPEYNIKLYENTTKGKFIDVTQNAKLNITGFPNAVTTGDFNKDGWTDIYISNDFEVPDFIFYNNRNGTFRNSAKTSFNHTSYFSMGVDVADINNDGLLDIFVVDMVAEDNKRLKSNMSGMNPKSFWKTVNKYGIYQYMYNTLHLNNGNETYSDIAQLTGMASTDWSWSNLIADFNNDGLKDVYITNGLMKDIRNTDADKKISDLINKKIFNWINTHDNQPTVKNVFDIIEVKEYVKLMPSQPIKNYMFKNNGNLTFEKVMNEWGLEQLSFSNGAAYGDLDNDGDLEIVVNNINSSAFIYKNNANDLPNSNYLRVTLLDKKNRPLLGSNVKIYCKTKMQMIELSNTRGMYSTSEITAHFGLYKSIYVDSLIVTWPNGKKSVRKNLVANQSIAIEMNDALFSIANQKESYPKYFQKKKILGYVVHKENDFDDFKYQTLLPHKLSQFGPALTVGDINHDNLEDVFFGGAKGYPAKLFVQQKNGTFYPTNEKLWNLEKDYEDTDSIIFDVDGDNDNDLFVISGGNFYKKNNAHYKNRLYINDGKGNFSIEPLRENEYHSSSVVKTADIDRDGDLDLFVGGRHIPHKYPLPASSKLWKNENGKLEDVTNTQAKDFSNLGMVTDAVWLDYDLDHDLDLIVVGEWMPITLFKNENGVLKKTSIPLFEDLVGWWYCIEKGDFDNDGDFDLLVGNLGLNYKYKTDKNSPFDIYYNDFDKNGKKDIVLGYYNGSEHFPVRGFSCSSNQIPILKKKIKTYNNFASLSIYDIYNKDKLNQSLHLKTTTFASLYIENLGNGKFSMKKLPKMAQLSSINDIITKDFNNDGNLDAIIAGNMFVSEVETPRNDAGTGLLLLGRGNGTFTPIMSRESGFFTNKDVKKMKLLNTSQNEVILVGNNNDVLQSFSITK